MIKEMSLYRKIVNFSAISIPLIFQIILKNGVSSYLMYIPYIIICIAFLFIKRKIKVNKSIVAISIGIVIVYLFLPFLFLTITYNNFKTNIFYSILNIVFLFAIIITSAEIKRNEYEFILRGTLISNTIYLSYLIIKNFYQINLQSIQLVFNGNRQGRADFQLGHPNIAAMFIVVNIILIYIVIYKIYNMKKIAIMLSLSFVIPLLSTGSRTASYSLLLFYVLELYWNKLKQCDEKIRIICTLIFISGVIYILYSYLLQYFLENSSGRNVAIINNIEVLIKNKKILYGFGPIQISRLKRIISQLMISDNWYMTQLIRYGIIGLGIIVFILVLLVKNLFKCKYENRYGISLLIMLLFYSFAENVLFVPGVILPWVCWMIFFCEIRLNTIKI